MSGFDSRLRLAEIYRVLRAIRGFTVKIFLQKHFTRFLFGNATMRRKAPYFIEKIARPRGNAHQCAVTERAVKSFRSPSIAATSSKIALVRLCFCSRCGS
jgi:hypothetical protein